MTEIVGASTYALPEVHREIDAYPELMIAACRLFKDWITAINLDLHDRSAQSNELDRPFASPQALTTKMALLQTLSLLMQQETQQHNNFFASELTVLDYSVEMPKMTLTFIHEPKTITGLDAPTSQVGIPQRYVLTYQYVPLNEFGD